MKIVCIIPTRYASTRFPGKPLADICGKPMIWWVYRQAKKVVEFDDVIIAADNKQITELCDKLGMKYVLTKDSHPDHIARVHEVSENLSADYYVCVNGDEPLIDPECIRKVLPKEIVFDVEYFGGAMRKLTDAAETVDFANIKIVATDDGRCIYMSRSPVPYPRGTLLFNYKKYIGIECFNKKALDFFVSSAMGSIEKIEDIDHLRFLENGKALYFTEVDSESISVDTPKDLDFVRSVITEKIKTGEIKL